MLAVTRPIPDSFADCINTYITRSSPCLKRARMQWSSYLGALERMGCEVVILGEAPDLPDSPFVEDTGLALGDRFIQSRMDSPSRSAEIEVVSKYFSSTHRIVPLQAPGTLDGGDVLRVGRHFFVGQSSRTNLIGYRQLKAHVESLGCTCSSVAVNGCLHLKTAVTALDDETLLLNPEWVSVEDFSSFRILEVSNEEPFSANILRVKNKLLAAAGYPHRDSLLCENGYDFQRVDISELEKAEAGLTCLSIIVTS